MEIQENQNKFLNLVFENWKNGEPTPNCPETAGNNSFNLPGGFFDFYERYYSQHLNYERNSIPVKNWKLEDVKNNKDKNFYFCIKTPEPLKHLIEDKKLELSYGVKNHLVNCNNFYFMFIREHESETEEDLVSLKTFIKERNLPESKFIVLTNNDNFKNIVDKCNIEYHIHKLNLLQITSTSVFSEMISEFNTNKKGKFFICFNKSPKKHRYSIIAALDAYGILEDTNWSFIGKFPETHYDDTKRFFNDDDLKKINFNKFKNLELKESDFEIGKNHFNSDLSVNYEGFPEINNGGAASGGLMLPEFDYIYRESYCNIVTETLFEDVWNSIHITEKTFRPFYFYLFPIFVATHNHVNVLREKFGFDLFDDMVDHSYDNEPNQIKRLKMIINEIIRISKNKDKFIEFYKNNQDRFEKNKQILKQLSYDDTDFFYFKSLLS